MNRTVQYLNFAGVLALAVLCAVQWQRNRSLNVELNGLQKDHYEQTAKLGEQDKTIRGLTSDLALLKDQVGDTHSTLKESSASLRKAENERRQLELERDQLRTSVTNWASAVTARDKRIDEASEQLLALSQQLDESIRKYNTLASNYNSVVKQLDEVRRRLQTEAAKPAQGNQ